jgi:hypothetical protein
MSLCLLFSMLQYSSIILYINVLPVHKFVFSMSQEEYLLVGLFVAPLIIVLWRQAWHKESE